jgi:hypothetical protein
MLPCKKSQVFTLSLELSPLSFWAPFTFGEACFHKIKSREALSRSHNDLNTTDDNVSMTELLLIN